MIAELLASISRAMMYVILAELFWNSKKTYVLHGKSILAITFIVFAQLVSWQDMWKNCEQILPMIVMCVLVALGLVSKSENDIHQILIGAIESYVISFLINLICGIGCGLISKLFVQIVNIDYKYIMAILLRVILIVYIWIKYEWLQIFCRKIAVSIAVFVGSVVVFFQQFFEIALIEKNYNFAAILTLFFHFTMIFTAFMLLQHNRLTAKQQAIEEDNRQMSQRLHRSKDVLGVVSQVVASEDHIDPKLRKELADFCDDEMNEMQDRALGANLIGDTGIELVNVMLQKQMIRCADLNISFDVMIPAPIDGYIREIGISVTEFMRMLNDLLKNAVKAILSSENTHRELLLIMGEAGNDCFEIRLYDSGVPFPPKILEHLGERGNTTDGTGNGIADTVETLRHYRASFVIEPIEPGTDIYTKCIHIAFDGQGCLPQNGEQ